MTTVANEILTQLGGGRFIAMTGAKNLVALSNSEGLRFRLPQGFSEINGKKTGINMVTVRLTDRDDYDVEFGSARGVNYKVKHTVEGVYCDMLQNTFTEHTGLATRL